MAASPLTHQRQQRHPYPLLVVAAMALCLFPSVSAFLVAPCPRLPQQPPSLIGGRSGSGSCSRLYIARQLPSQLWAAQRQQEGEEGEEKEGWLVKLGYKAGEEDKTRSLKERLKSAGIAGVFSYVASEVLFWFISLPAGILFYHQTTGEWLDLSTPEGKAKVAGFSAGFLAFARVALPVRAAVALAITPPLSKYVIQPLIERGVLKEREGAGPEEA